MKLYHPRFQRLLLLTALLLLPYQAAHPQQDSFASQAMAVAAPPEGKGGGTKEKLTEIITMLTDLATELEMLKTDLAIVKTDLAIVKSEVSSGGTTGSWEFCIPIGVELSWGGEWEIGGEAHAKVAANAPIPGGSGPGLMGRIKSKLGGKVGLTLASAPSISWCWGNELGGGGNSSNSVSGNPAILASASSSSSDFDNLVAELNAVTRSLTTEVPGVLASIGIDAATVPERANTVTEIIRNADMSLSFSDLVNGSTGLEDQIDRFRTLLPDASGLGQITTDPGQLIEQLRDFNPCDTPLANQSPLRDVCGLGDPRNIEALRQQAVAEIERATQPIRDVVVKTDRFVTTQLNSAIMGIENTVNDFSGFFNKLEKCLKAGILSSSCRNQFDVATVEAVLDVDRQLGLRSNLELSKTEYQPHSSEQPLEFKLNSSYPNPANPTTSISYSIPHDDMVHLSVYNASGEEVARLVSGYQNAGNHTVQWDADVASGVYYYRLVAGPRNDTKTVVIVK